MSIGQRIKEFLKNEDITQDALALKSGVTRQTINNAVKGKNAPSGEVISKIVIAYPRLNAKWLLTGEGEMYLPESNGPVNNINDKKDQAGVERIHRVNEESEKYLSKIEALENENAALKEALKAKEELLEIYRKSRPMQ
jgi:transcriptional regulator with XRE-family HTH domain